MGGKQRISFSHKLSEQTLLQDTSGFTPEFNFKKKNAVLSHSHSSARSSQSIQHGAFYCRSKEQTGSMKPGKTEKSRKGLIYIIPGKQKET